MQITKQSQSTGARAIMFFTTVRDDDGKTVLNGTLSATSRWVKADGTTAASAGTFAQPDSTNMPGLRTYTPTSTELNTLGAAVLYITGTIGGVAFRGRQVPISVAGIDIHDSVRLGATALPNAAAEAAGGLYTRGSGAGQINQAANGQIDANLVTWKGSAPNALVSSRVDASVGAMATGVVTATAIASDAITAAKIADAAIDRATFAQDALDLFREKRRNTAQAGGASTITLDASASAVDDFYNGDKIRIVGGTGSGQTRNVSDYVGSTKVLTVSEAWSTNPDNTSVFEIFGERAPALTLGAGSITLATFADDALLGAFGILASGTAQDGAATSITLASGASSEDPSYVNATILLTDGVGALQSTQITGYDGTTKVATVADAFATVPDNTTKYVIFASSSPLAAARAAWERLNIEGSYKAGDLLRGLVSLVMGLMSGADTDSPSWKSLDGTKTRWSGTTDDSGRPSITPGDLT